MPKTKEFNASKDATALVKLIFDGEYVVHENDIPNIEAALQAAYDAGRADLAGRDLVDVLDCEGVELAHDGTGKVWVNVDGRCIFRAGHAAAIVVELRASPPPADIGFTAAGGDGDGFEVGETVTDNGVGEPLTIVKE